MSVRWFVFQDDGRAVYRFEGDFNGIEEGNDLIDSVDDVLIQGVKRFELDFTHTRYLSSFGIAVLVRLKKKLIKVGANLHLLQVNRDIRRVLTVTRTDTFLLTDDEESR